MAELIYLDFEYHNTAEPNLAVVCVAIGIPPEAPYSLWLYRDAAAQKSFTDWILSRHAMGDVFVAYNVIAEAGALYSLGLDPTKFLWLDLLLEWKQLRNGNHKRLYGKFVDKKGNPKESFPPPVDEFGKAIKKNRIPKHQRKNNAQTTVSLVSCVYNLTGELISTVHKDEVRNRIIRGGPFNEEEKKTILEYCTSDVVFLPRIADTMRKEIRTLSRQTAEQYRHAAFSRGEWSARLAVMERIGIPVNVERLRNVARNYGEITDTAIRALNDVYPFFVWEKNKWVQKGTAFEAYIKREGLLQYWPKTDAGKLSTSKDTLEDNEHLPEILAFRRTREMINTVRAYSKGDTTWEEVSGGDDEDESPNTFGKEGIFQRIGSDGRLRVYFNPMGTQTSRNAPPATSFILAQSAWLRAAMEAPRGKSIISIDYSSEEFLIAGIMARDINMQKFYASGDIYLGFAKSAGLVPQDATKKSHAKMREMSKGCVLGMQFSLGRKKLHTKLIRDSGNLLHPEELTIKLIDSHRETFSDYWDWNADTIETYASGQPLSLSDGWYIFCDNPNPRSVGNFKVQGTGAAILRRAVAKCQDAGIEVFSPLHDALYLLAENDMAEKVSQTAEKLMIDAFREVCGGEVRVETKIIPHGELYLEGKGRENFRRMGRYMLNEADYQKAYFEGVVE